MPMHTASEFITALLVIASQKRAIRDQLDAVAASSIPRILGLLEEEAKARCVRDSRGAQSQD